MMAKILPRELHAKEIAQNTTFQIRLIGMQQWRVRIWIGMWLMRVASWVMWMPIEFVEDDEESSKNQGVEEEATGTEGKTMNVESSWCDECGKRKGSTVLLGDVADRDSQWLNICLDCLKKAVALLEAGNEDTD